MNKILAYILICSFFVLSSCLNKMFDIDEQVFPELNFKEIMKITYSSNESDLKKTFEKTEELKLFQEFFTDSTNYYKSIKMEPSSIRSNKSIHFFTESDTMSLHLYPTDSNRLEVGYFERKKPNTKKWDFLRYHRFYINKKLIDLVESDFD